MRLDGYFAGVLSLAGGVAGEEGAMRLVCGCLFLMLAASPGLAAEARWVELQTSMGDKPRALYGGPGPGGPAGAVIFSHGTGVRMMGAARAAAEGNMDIADYVAALSEAGFAVIAPERRFLAGRAYFERGQAQGSGEAWDETIARGIATIEAAAKFLAAQAGVDGARIAAVGFSEGGNVTLWAAIENPTFKAVALLAPATIRPAATRQLRTAAGRGKAGRLPMPVFVAAGRDDQPSIRKVLSRRLLPNLEGRAAETVARLDYPGGHSWFYKPKQALLGDLVAFLKRHIGG